MAGVEPGRERARCRTTACKPCTFHVPLCLWSDSDHPELNDAHPRVDLYDLYCVLQAGEGGGVPPELNDFDPRAQILSRFSCTCQSA